MSPDLALFRTCAVTLTMLNEKVRRMNHRAPRLDRLGEKAVVRNETGHLQLLVTLSNALPRGVAYSPKGRWPKREPGRANVNALNPGESADMGQSTSVHGVEVIVSPSS